jgi:ribonuclease HI
MYILEFDGLFQRVPGETDPTQKAGLLGYGWLITRDGVIVAKGHGLFAREKEATSGVAEYVALLEGLDALSDLGVNKEMVEVRGDAKFVIDQMTGDSEVNSDSVKPLHRHAMRLARSFHHINWVWTPRKRNRQADALSRLGLRKFYKNPSYYKSAFQAINPNETRKWVSRKFHSLVDLRVYRPAGLRP